MFKTLHEFIFTELQRVYHEAGVNPNCKFDETLLLLLDTPVTSYFINSV